MPSTVVKNPQFRRQLNRTFDEAMGYLAGAVRNKAIKSIKAQSRGNPHSLPGEPVRTPRPLSRSVYRNTIHRDYNPANKVLIVGPIKTFKNKNSVTYPADGGTVPHMLEYGGTMVATKPQLFLRKRTPRKYWKLLKGKKRQYEKWVVIKPGSYRIAPRPTMRLAFNETLTQRNLQSAFRSVGVSDPSSLKKVI